MRVFRGNLNKARNGKIYLRILLYMEKLRLKIRKERSFKLTRIIEEYKKKSFIVVKEEKN